MSKRVTDSIKALDDKKIEPERGRKGTDYKAALERYKELLDKNLTSPRGYQLLDLEDKNRVDFLPNS